MTDIIGNWVRAIAGAAVICSVAIAVTPKGKVKNVLKLICGIVMIIAMLSPFIDTNVPALSMDIARYKQMGDDLVKQATDENSNLSRSIIEQQCAAYISDKAQSMDIKLESVSVSAKWGDEGCWYPDEINICANVTSVQKAMVSNLINAELGIPAERQNWSEYEN